MKNKRDSKIDPSDIKQEIVNITLQVHCCRYWKLTEWEFKNLSVPFWRIYYNTKSGASVSYKNKTFELNRQKILLISPYTSFSTSLKNKNTDRILGKRIKSQEELNFLEDQMMIDHLFIHFNLGFQYDYTPPAIYEIEISPSIQQQVDKVRFEIIEENKRLSFNQMLSIHALILQLISQIPQTSWDKQVTDTRVLKVIDYIDKYYAEPLPNYLLATKAAMATNSFLRLFKHITGSTIQQFVQNKRIEKAIQKMHNQETSIEQIAEQCGFSNRQHFSKVFKRYIRISPAQYRKTQVM